MSPCIFLPNKPEKNGYVRRGRARPGKERSAHRAAYVEAYGPIPEGYTIDHECHNADLECPGGDACRHRACVNPEHLEAKPSGDNARASKNTWASINSAKTHCPQGHEYTAMNAYIAPSKGDRQCRMCKLIDHQARVRARKAREWGLSDVGVIVS
jgi:hypothetical protein